MNGANHIIMLASENDALKSGKVGGLADVVRDLPNALADLGWRSTVITPSYGFLHKENPSTLLTKVSFPFGGKTLEGELWHVTPKRQHPHVRHLVVEHPEIRGTPIYYNDPPEHAFAQDATKYALFCSAVGQYLNSIDEPFILHLHDWHTAFMMLLRELHPNFSHLKKSRTVFTIHNIALQGTRPMLGEYASVESWFPELFTSGQQWIAEWKDPRHAEPTFTPMAAGIQYADKVNTVSPTYAEEILQTSNHANGFYGGEGLEKVLQKAKKEQRLFGILNGCEYPQNRSIQKMSFQELCHLMSSEVHKTNERNHEPFFEEIRKRIDLLKTSSPSIILTSVTRVVEQKMKILFEKCSDGITAIDGIMSRLEAHNGVYVLLGNGTVEYEERFLEIFQKHKRFIFFKLYSDAVAQALYANGTLFMMPSSFEPCGISQMIAMRNGQACVVHAVGGLRDTVADGINGFSFFGNSLVEQANGCVKATERAMKIVVSDKKKWNDISQEAVSTRFTWEKSAKQYIDLLYS
jgi:starch synthase